MLRQYVEGRIVERARQFAALSPELQEETKACEQYLILKQDDVFGMHHATPFRTVYSVRGKQLLETVEAWVREKDRTKEATVAQPAPVADAPADDNQLTVEDLGPPVVDAIPSTTPDAIPSTAPSPASILDELRTRQDHAKHIVVALMLHGFLTSQKESNDAFVNKDFDLYVPLLKQVHELSFVSVWEAMEEAVFAAPVKRKAGLFAPFTHGKEVYFVVNDKRKTIYLYESDTVPSPPVAVFGTTETCVSYDHTHYTYGVKIWNNDASELLNARNKMEQDWLMYAVVSMGVQYIESAVIDETASLYARDEKDLEGKDVPFAQFKDKVLLIVNVASQCPSALLHFSELNALDDKYRSDGLVILGCPCNQFGGLEFGTSQDIQAFLQPLGVRFTMLEPRDVHGVEARPLFTYLNKTLPGRFGPFVEWNFTKFLVDRSGRPFQRYAPDETPLSFEEVIVELLHQDPPVDRADARVAALDAAMGVVETVDAATAVAAVATGSDVADTEPQVVEDASQLLEEGRLAEGHEEGRLAEGHEEGRLAEGHEEGRFAEEHEEGDLEEVEQEMEDENSHRRMPISTTKPFINGELESPAALYM